MEGLLPYFNMVNVPHQTVGVERMSDYRGVGLERFHCTCNVEIYSFRGDINTSVAGFNEIIKRTTVQRYCNHSIDLSKVTPHLLGYAHSPNGGLL